MKSFGNKRKPRVIKVDDPDEGDNTHDAPPMEAESSGKCPHPELLAHKPDADYRGGPPDG